ARRRDPQVFFGVWSLALLLPVLNVIPLRSFVNDRYMYLPIVGLTGFLGSLVMTWRTVVPNRAWRIGGACVSVSLAAMTFAQSKIWHDSLALWTETVRRAPSAKIAWNNLGLVQLASGNTRAAEQSLLRAATALPHQNALPFVNLGDIYLDRTQP